MEDISVWYVTTPDLETICKTAEDAKEFLEQYILYNYPAEADSLIECLQKNYHKNKETFAATSRDFDFVCAEMGYFIFRDETVSDADDSTIEDEAEEVANRLFNDLEYAKDINTVFNIFVAKLGELARKYDDEYKEQVKRFTE
jgi:hypothetical protein